MSDLYETDYVVEDEDGYEIPLYEDEDGNLVDEDGNDYGTVGEAELEDGEEPEYGSEDEAIAEVQQR